MSNSGPVELPYYYLHSVDEFGLNLRGKHLFSKGALIELESAFLGELTGQGDTHRLTVVSTSMIAAEQAFHSYLEFDTTNEELLGNLHK